MQQRSDDPFEEACGGQALKARDRGIALVSSCSLMGLRPYALEVEVDVSGGLPAFTIVGLPDASVSEARERVKPAIKNSGLIFPDRKITVNLAPAEFRKEGPSLDLPIALGVLSASGQVAASRLREFIFLGELSLDGRVRGVNGTLPMAIMARHGPGSIVLPRENAEEASLVDGLAIYPVETLAEALEVLNGSISPLRGRAPGDSLADGTWDVDFSEIKGQAHAKRALEVAAAGGHNIVMVGSPGSGKTMLARRFPSILPPLQFDEALEVTKIYSIAGKLDRRNILIRERPFRAPHHSTSPTGLVGGGTVPRPGEVSLAHRGVLFLDEMPEFQPRALEALRQPLEDGTVTIPRARMTLTFPASFMLAGALNPCPCGYAGDRERRCRCRPDQVRKYRARLSGPLLDRIDIHIEVPRLTCDDLSGVRQGETSEKVRRRVVNARRRQQKRFAARAFSCNAHMHPRDIRRCCAIPTDAQMLLQHAVRSMALSARAYDRILKLARTIADLAGREAITIDDVAEAISYRSLDRGE